MSTAAFPGRRKQQKVAQRDTLAITLLSCSESNLSARAKAPAWQKQGSASQEEGVASRCQRLTAGSASSPCCSFPWSPLPVPISSAPALTSGRPRKASFAMFCFLGGGGHFLKEQRKGNEATGVSSELRAQLAL